MDSVDLPDHVDAMTNLPCQIALGRTSDSVSRAGHLPREGGKAVETSMTLGGILEGLGTNLIDVIAGRLNGRSGVSGISIYDPFDVGLQFSGAVVLGVGTVSPEAIEELITLAVEQHAVAVVLREPAKVDPEVLQSAVEANVVILGVIPGVDWSQVASSLSRALELPLARHGLDDGSSYLELTSTEQLSQIANALADLLDAPVTIEDTNSSILAFSRNQNEGDECRKTTILHREVPKIYTDQMKTDGVFTQIYGSETPVFIDSERLMGHDLSRIVIRLVSGKVIIGSIWIAVPEPLSDADNELVIRTAHEAARVLDQVRLEGGKENSRRRHLVTQLITGGREAEDAAKRSGLVGSAFCLMVLSVPVNEDGKNDDSDARQLLRLSDSLNLHLVSYNKNSAATVWGETVVGVLPLDVRTPDSFVTQVAQRFVDRSRKRTGMHLVVTPIVPKASDLGAAKDEALRTLEVMNRATRPRPDISRIERTQDAFIDVILMEVRDKLMENWATRQTPIRRLVEYDKEHNADFVATLDAHFRHFGAVIPAAASIHVHPNTFRYRLKRLNEICGVDVNDDESRFRALVELRLLGLGASELNDGGAGRRATRSDSTR